jgi:hypothetical protein
MAPHVSLEPLSIWLAVTVTVPGLVALKFTVMFWHLGVGGVVSWTFTVKELVAVLPLPSAAEQLTVVVPNAKALPEAGVQTAVTAPSQVSLAVAV